jgi:hypothetical protein
MLARHFPHGLGLFRVQALHGGHLSHRTPGAPVQPLCPGHMAERPRQQRLLPLRRRHLRHGHWPVQQHLGVPALQPRHLCHRAGAHHALHSLRPWAVPTLGRFGRHHLPRVPHRHLCVSQRQHRMHPVSCAHFDSGQRLHQARALPLQSGLHGASSGLHPVSCRHLQEFQRQWLLRAVPGHDLRCHHPRGRSHHAQHLHPRAG